MQIIYFDEHVTWKNHIHDICAKVNAVQAFIKEISTTAQHLLLLQKVVRPILEHASPIWVPQWQTDNSALEKV